VVLLHAERLIDSTGLMLAATFVMASAAAVLLVVASRWLFARLRQSPIFGQILHRAGSTPRLTGRTAIVQQQGAPARWMEVPGALLFGGGATLLIWQVVRFLQDGVWRPMPLLRVILWTAPSESTFARWLIAPDSWIGLQRITVGLAQALPLWLVMILLGICVTELLDACVPAADAIARIVHRNAVSRASQVSEEAPLNRSFRILAADSSAIRLSADANRGCGPALK
jgi:hypothetical protein